jgi:myo-inositol 2-dehydrogenase / D-chiro-inositol 1-dehydrogenase
MTRPLGVGLLGAGPVTQAIHLPTIATLSGRLKVVHVMDVDRALATAVAERVGASSSTDLHALLSDPGVDIVAICSPDRFHAEHAIAACEAGKKAVLCEKPLATSVEDATQIAAVSRACGVPVIVGTMHRYDPAVIAALSFWDRLGETAALVQSTIFLPPNDTFVANATELAAPAAPLGIPDRPWSPDVEAHVLRLSILGLAIHSIPLLRHLLPRFDHVSGAHLLNPAGYVVTLGGSSAAAQLVALLPGRWPTHWTLEASTPSAELRVVFPPSYVLAGSARAEVMHAGAHNTWTFASNGYQDEWSHVADVAESIEEPLIDIETSVGDLQYALKLAEQGADRLLGDRA